MFGSQTLTATLLNLRWRMHVSPVGQKEIAAIGILAWMRYKYSQPKTVMKIRIGGTKLAVRSRTHDLEVAMTSLGGEFDSLEGLLPRQFAGTVIDAGGYIGTASLSLRRLFPRAKIVCIEPSSENLKILRYNLRNETNLEIIHGTLMGQRGDVQLSDIGTGEWGYSASPLSDSSRLTTELLETVPGLSLSDLGVNSENFGVLKLDIEGGEMDLLTHGKEGLNQILIIIAELHDDVVPGCSEASFGLSASRQLVATPGEKWLSLSR